uniref:CCHC-type domain-containing protein n=1 Tax=Tanacetum cinerariifolium TaxID=118510 RepID=A0A699J920_TANCI|nr:hypothetical protein [Tanacetum cinerariifolium]
MGDMRREVGDMQAELLALQEQPKRARLPREDARVPDHQDALKDADSEVKKLEIEMWNLKVKGNDVSIYTKRFQELTLICTKFVANETEKIDKYISGLTNKIYGNFKSSKPKTLDETIELANDFMDQKICTYAERQTNKRKANDLSKNNHGPQQQPAKRQNVTKAYNMGSGEKKPYGGNFPKAIPKGSDCFECGALGHFKRDFPKLKSKDRGNVNAQGWVYAIGNAERNGNASRDPDSNVITDNDEKESRLTIISCSKAQEYMTKGGQIFWHRYPPKRMRTSRKESNSMTYQSSETFLKCFLTTCWVFLQLDQ